jgi:hypothetical protein
VAGLAVERAAGHGPDGGHNFGQAAHGGGFGGAFVAAQQHAAQAGVHGAQQQRLLEGILPDERGKGVVHTKL